MDSSLSYVRWVQDNVITIFCDNKKKEHTLLKLGAKKKLLRRKVWIIRCENERDLAMKLQNLNDNAFMFAGGSGGWNPIDIYILMREKGLVSGNVMEIVWTSSNCVSTRLL